MREHSICASLEGEQLDLVEHVRSPDQAVKRGAVLLAEGSTLRQYLTVRQGWVMTYSTLPDGRRQIHAFETRGALLGRIYGADEPSPYAIEALTDVSLCILPAAAAHKLFLQMPEMAVDLARSASRNQELAYAQLMSVGRRSAHERIAYLLLGLWQKAHVAAARVQASEVVSIPLTQQHIADALGLTSVHVSRVLKDLRTRGLVRLHNHQLEILDRERLQAVAAGEA